MQVVLDPDTKVMTISGEREVDRPVDDDGDFVRVERKVGRFERRFKLPDNIDTDNITAKVLATALLQKKRCCCCCCCCNWRQAQLCRIETRSCMHAGLLSAMMRQQHVEADKLDMCICSRSPLACWRCTCQRLRPQRTSSRRSTWHKRQILLRIRQADSQDEGVFVSKAGNGKV